MVSRLSRELTFDALARRSGLHLSEKEYKRMKKRLKDAHDDGRPKKSSCHWPARPKGTSCLQTSQQKCFYNGDWPGTMLYFAFVGGGAAAPKGFKNSRRSRNNCVSVACALRYPSIAFVVFVVNPARP